MTDFATWEQPTLAKFAAEVNEQNKEFREALEQVRQDLKDAMQLLREQVKEV